jgi:hypothetical protein
MLEAGLYRHTDCNQARAALPAVSSTPLTTADPYQPTNRCYCFCCQLDTALSELSSYSHLAFTSKNGILAVLEHLSHLKGGELVNVCLYRDWCQTSRSAPAHRTRTLLAAYALPSFAWTAVDMSVCTWQHRQRVLVRLAAAASSAGPAPHA